MAGRPTKYKPEYAEQAKILCRLGAIDSDLADAFFVTEKTINLWKDKYPEFLQSIKENKEVANDQVKQALFKRAVGCSVPDSDIKVINGEVVITPLEKNFPPDTAACMAWLHNRDADNWKPRKAAEDREGEDKGQPVSINFSVSPRITHD